MKLIFRIAPALIVLGLPVLAQTWVSDLVLVPVENGAAGTTLYNLAKLDSEGRAVAVTGGETAGVVGIVQQGAGKSGRAGIAQMGAATCNFDGATKSGDYVQPSTEMAGMCHDAGEAFPNTGLIVGRALSTNAKAGAYQVLVFPTEIRGTAPTVSGGTTASAPGGGAMVPQVAVAGIPVAAATGGTPGGAKNSIQYNAGSSLGGVLNTAQNKMFLTQAGSGTPLFSDLALSDLPSISSGDLSDSSALVRTSQITPAGTTPDIAPQIGPGATLQAYGDSITAGKGASSPSTRYVALIATAKGWTLQDHAIGGDGLFDQLREHLWGSPINAQSLALFMIGANDAGYVYHQADVWDPALQAAYLWLLTQNKDMGSSMATRGTWSKDTVLSGGIYTTQDKAGATGRTFGNVVYVVARSTPKNSPTFTIKVDDTTYGPYTTPVPWTTVRGSNFAPYAVRIGNLSTTYHTVTVTNVGTGELHMDFMAGNKGQETPTGPYLYATTVYKTATAWEFTYQYLNNQIRSIATQLAADGLGIVLADAEGDCANPNMVDTTKPGGSNCSLSDGAHPNDAGEKIIANAFLRMMPSTGGAAATGAGANPSFNIVSANMGNVTTMNSTQINTSEVASSSWLRLKAQGPYYWLIAGTGHLVASEPGMVSIGTDTSGALGALYSPHSVRATNMIAGGYARGSIRGVQNLDVTKNTIVWTLTGDSRPAFTTTAGTGMRYTIMLCQDSVGGHVFTWPATVKNGMAIGLAPNQCSVQDFVSTDLGQGDLVGVTSGSMFQP